MKDRYANFQLFDAIILQNMILMLVNSYFRFGKLLGLIPSLGIF